MRLPPPYIPTNALFIDNNPAGGNTFSTAASFGGAPMRLASGSYTGDGLDDRAIAGVGFTPDVVFIKCECNRPGVARTSTMVGDAAKTLNSTGNLVPDLVQSLDFNGFTVGSEVNVNKDGEIFHWAALKAGEELELGTYMGDDTDDRSIVGVSFQPDWVATFGDGNDSIFRTRSVSGDVSFAFTGNSDLSDRIQGLQSRGFQVGSNPDVNELGVTYHYLAWNSSVNVSLSSYDGDGKDDRSIAGTGFTPQLVWIKREDNSRATWRPASVSGDLSLQYGNSAAGSDLIQSFESNGFQVGSSDPVNKKNRTYHYLALRDGGP
ncbi:MAG: hypothetical protein ACE5Q6_05930 [Dehalococcoidia bacterium]